MLLADVGERTEKESLTTAFLFKVKREGEYNIQKTFFFYIPPLSFTQVKMENSRNLQYQILEFTIPQ